MIVLSASTKEQSPLTEIQRKSAILCGFAENEYLHLTIPSSYPKHPSWFRIRALLDHLPNHDMILWLDSDAMLLRDMKWDTWFPGEHMLYLAKDVNGWQNGVALWRNTPQARQFLWQIYDLHPRFEKHPWHEQGALHVLSEQMDIYEMSKVLFNAYESDLCKETAILHLPSKSNDYRYKVMKEQLDKLIKP